MYFIDDILVILVFVILLILVRPDPNFLRKKVLILIANLGMIYFLLYDGYAYFLELMVLVAAIHGFLLKSSRVHPVFHYSVPVLFIICVKFVTTPVDFHWFGVSYLCFRMLKATQEVRRQDIKSFGHLDYLSYCFFLPTFKLGPIGSLKDHLESWEDLRGKRISDIDWTQLARIGFGAIKYVFLTAVLTNSAAALGYDTWADASKWYDIIILGFFSYAAVYLGFSGFNDISIGASHLAGFKMVENFHQPFRARNISDFWLRWHSSLTQLLRELIFFPMNLFLLRKFGVKKEFLILPITYFFLFFIVGIWHELEMNFFVLGTYHAVCSIIYVLFSRWVNQHWKSYQKSILAREFSILMTQVYISVSFLLFDLRFEEVLIVLKRVFN